LLQKRNGAVQSEKIGPFHEVLHDHQRLCNLKKKRGFKKTAKKRGSGMILQG